MPFDLFEFYKLLIGHKLATLFPGWNVLTKKWLKKDQKKTFFHTYINRSLYDLYRIYIIDVYYITYIICSRSCTKEFNLIVYDNQ